MDPQYIYLFVFAFIILSVLLFFYYWLPGQTNIYKYNIPLLTDETTFDESYEANIHLETYITTRKTLYVPKLGYGLSFVWEMYIPTINGNDKWNTNYNRLKPIISMEDSPVISYHPKKNYLSIVLKYRNNPFYAQYAEIKFDQIKPQRWSKYIVIIENTIIRLYIDGVLVSTKTLPSVPVIYDIKSDIILGNTNNNFQGKIRNMTLYPYPLGYDELTLV
jgi:hypothetical protein